MKKIFMENGLPMGRMISMSKSGYRDKNPDNLVVFNANIFVLGEGKIWYGDLDITKERTVLEDIAKELGKDLFILREMDGRFGKENIKDSEIISLAVCKINK